MVEFHNVVLDLVATVCIFGMIELCMRGCKSEFIFRNRSALLKMFALLFVFSVLGNVLIYLKQGKPIMGMFIFKEDIDDIEDIVVSTYFTLLSTFGSAWLIYKVVSFIRDLFNKSDKPQFTKETYIKLKAGQFRVVSDYRFMPDIDYQILSWIENGIENTIQIVCTPPDTRLDVVLHITIDKECNWVCDSYYQENKSIITFIHEVIHYLSICSGLILGILIWYNGDVSMGITNGFLFTAMFMSFVVAAFGIGRELVVRSRAVDSAIKFSHLCIVAVYWLSLVVWVYYLIGIVYQLIVLRV